MFKNLGKVFHYMKNFHLALKKKKDLSYSDKIEYYSTTKLFCLSNKTFRR